MRREVVRIRQVGDVDCEYRHECRDDALDRRTRAATSDVPGDHRSGGLDPPEQEREDQDDARGGPERERRSFPMEATGLVVDLDAVHARRVRPDPCLGLPPSAGRFILLLVPGAPGPEEPSE